MKLSIIVPFYNAQNVIKRTINSLKNFTRDDIEIIFVNDGSTDDSLNIVHKYSLKNMQIINIKHSGVSAARNTGIINATGDYILFLDADDTLEQELISFFLKIYKNNYDLIKYGYNFVTRKNKAISYQCVKNIEVINKIDLKKLYTTNLYNHVWSLIIKRELIISNNIKFNEKHSYAEDYEFNKQIILYAKNIYFSNLCLYNYYYNHTSVTQASNINITTKSIVDALEVYLDTLKKCQNKDYFEQSVYHASHEVSVTIIKLLAIKRVSLKNIKKKLKEITNLKCYKEFNKLVSNYKTTNLYYYILVKNNFIALVLYRIYYLIKFYIKKKIY